MSDAILNEAYERFRDTGPEWGEDKLTNHGPMAVEVMVRRGRAEQVHGWVDSYLTRLDVMPAASDVITAENWREALGDGNRIGDWTRYLDQQLAELPWRDVLELWWPRLLPGIAAGATHGLIRTSHAVRTLLGGDEQAPALHELARGIAFWAARSRAVPAVVTPTGTLDAAAALHSLPRVAEQTGPIAARFGQLAELDEWPHALAALRTATTPDDVRERLTELTGAACVHYLGHGHASPVLLVHAATAPNAVLRTLPALPEQLWQQSLSAVWAVSAALTAGYAPAHSVPRSELPDAPGGDDPVAEVISRAMDNGDEHVIKLTDTAVDAFTARGDSDALAAAVRVGQLLG